MTFKSILVPALSESTFPGAMNAALKLADQYCGHVVACQIRQPFEASFQPLPYPLEMSSVGLARSHYEGAIDELSQQLRTQFEAALTNTPVKELAFDGENIPQELTATWILRCGDPYELVSKYGRMSDIIVMQQSTPGGFVAETEIRQRILTEIGKPVLLLPTSGLPAFPKSALVGWNGSLEATRTLSAALPILKKMERTVLLSIGTLQNHLPTAQDAQHYLRFHGVEAEVKAVELSDTSVAAQVKSVAAEDQADLLVLGGYSHSRVRERIFGGVTQQILKDPEVPAFIVH